MSTKAPETKETPKEAPKVVDSPKSSKLGSKEDIDNYIQECFKDDYCKGKVSKTIDDNALQSYEKNKYNTLKTRDVTNTIVIMSWYIVLILLAVLLIAFVIWILGFTLGWFTVNPIEQLLALFGVSMPI